MVSEVLALFMGLAVGLILGGIRFVLAVTLRK